LFSTATIVTRKRPSHVACSPHVLHTQVYFKFYPVVFIAGIFKG